MRGTAAMPSCVASGGEKRAVGAHTGMPVVSVCGPLGCFPLSVVVVVIVRLAGDVKRESNKPLEEMENGAEKKCLGDAGSVTQSCSVPPMWVLCGTRDVSTACVGLGLCVGGVEDRPGGRALGAHLVREAPRAVGAEGGAAARADVHDVAALAAPRGCGRGGVCGMHVSLVCAGVRV